MLSRISNVVGPDSALDESKADSNPSGGESAKEMPELSKTLLNWDRMTKPIVLVLEWFERSVGVTLPLDWQRVAEFSVSIRVRARAAAYEGLGPTFLNETALLVENPSIPSDFTAPTIPAGLQCLDSRDGVERVSKHDRMVKFPLEDRQERHRIDSWGLAHQSGGNRQTKKSVRDRPTKRTVLRGGVVHMDWIKIPGYSREKDNIRLSHRPSRTLPLIADDEVVK